MCKLTQWSLGLFPALVFLSTPAILLANPLGGVVAQGAAAFNPIGNVLTISQTSSRAVINWNSFNIGNAETTIFRFNGLAGANSAVLNRVNVGNPSVIAGMLQSTVGPNGPVGGTVLLLNPSGILFTPTAQINVGSLVATTLSIDDRQFMNRNNLTLNGSSTAGIQNEGNLTALGDIYLIAHTVQNSGDISAGGRAGLAAGTTVTLAQSGSERLRVVAGTPDTSAANGVENTPEGTIKAVTTELKAAGGNIYALAINNGGAIRANTITREGGRVVLRADGGRVVNSGSIEARGLGRNSKGGEVQITGGDVKLAAGSSVNTDGNAGGGSALVGGDFHGANPAVPNATHTVVEEGAVISANSLDHGDAGKAVVWANDTTEFGGSIFAQALGSQGRGGRAEISGREHLSLWGHAYLGGANGAKGSLLLDPGSVLIDSGPNTAPPATLDVFHDAWVIDQLNAGGADLTISTVNANNANAHTLTVDSLANVSWNSANNLLLRGETGVLISGPIANLGTGGLDVNSSAGDIAINNTLTFSGGGNVLLSAFGTLGIQSAIVAKNLNASGASILFNAPGTLVQTAGGQLYNGPVTLNQNTILADTANGSITFAGAVDADVAINNRTLAVNTGGATTFGTAVGGNQPLGSLTTDAAGTTSAKNVTTFGGITFNDDVTLNGTYDSSLGNGAFLAGKSSTLAGNVIVNSGAGNATFVGAVDADAALNTRILSVNSAGTTTFGSAVGANQRLASLTTDFPGTTSAKDVSTFGNITFNDAVTLNGTYDSSLGNGAFLAANSSTLAGNVIINSGFGTVTFLGPVDADLAANNRALTVNSATLTTFGSAVGGSQRLGSLTTDFSGTTSAKNVATLGNITFNNDVTLDGTYDSSAGDGSFLATKSATLAGNVTVNSGNGTATFTGAVDADSAANNRTLAVNSGGATTFGSAVGGNQRLGSLTTDAAGTSSAKDVTTGGNISFNDDVTLNGTYDSSVGNGAFLAGKTATLAGNVTVKSGAGNATFNGAVDADSAANNRTLAVNSSGTTMFGAAVGAGQTLATVTTDAGGSTAINGPSLTTSGNQTYNDSVTTSAGAALTAPTITFGGKLSPGGDLTAAGLTINGNLVFGAGSSLFVTLNGTTPGVTHDQITLNSGNITINNTATLLGHVGFSYSVNDTLTIIKNTPGTAISGQFASTSVTLNGQNFNIDTANTAGNNVALIRAPTSWIWDGGGGNNNWTTAANWTADLNSPGNGDTVHFAGILALTPINDNATGLQLTQILFDLGSGAFVLGGNGISLTGGIVNNSTTIQTVDMPLTLAGNQSFAAAFGAGALVFANTIDGAFNLTLSGVGVSLNGAVGQGTALANLTANAPLTIGGAGIRTSAGQTYNSPVTVSANTVLSDIGGGNVSFAAAVDADAAANNRTLDVNTAGTTTFGAAVGGGQRFGSLTTDAPGTTSAKDVTTSGNVTFNDDVTLNGTYDSSAGNGAFQAPKSATLAGNVTINSGNGTATFTGAVDADSAANNRTLAVNSGGATTFGSAVGGNQRLGSLATDAAGTSSAKDVTTGGNISFNDDVTLNGIYDSSAGNGAFVAAKAATLAGNVTVNSGNGNATFSGAVDADAAANNRTLAVNSGGVTTFGSAVGGNARLGGVTTDSPGTTSAKAVTTSGNISFNDDVTLNGTYDSSAGSGNFLAAKTATLAGNTTVFSGNGNATFNGAVDADAAANNRALAVNSAGATTLGATVGGNQRLGSLTTDAAGTSSAKDVATSGNITFNDDVTLNGTYDSSAANGNFLVAKTATLAGNVTVNSGNGNATFAGTVDADAAVNNRALAVNSGGATTFGAAVGGNQHLASLTTDAPGTTSARNVTTSGNIQFSDDVTFNGSYDSSAGNGNFLAGKTATLAGNVTVNSGNGNATFAGAVDADATANNRTLAVNSGGATSFGAAVGANQRLASLATDALGTSSAKSVTTSGDIGFNDDVTLNGTYDSSAGNGNFLAGKTATLAGDVLVNSGIGNASFIGAVDADAAANNRALTVNSGGATTFGSAVGANQRLGNLTTDASGTTSAKAVTTSGNISFNDDVTLNGTYDTSAGNGNFLAGKTATLAGNVTVNSGNGNASFVGAMDADAAANNRTLAVNSGGATTFGGTVGGNQRLGSLTTDAQGATSAKDVTTSGNITFNDDVTLNRTYDSSAGSGNFLAAKTATLAGNVTVSSGNGNATFTGAVDADGAANNRALAVNSGGTTTFSAAVGSNQRLGSLTTDAAGTTSARNVATLGNISFNDDVTLNGTYDSSVANGNFLAGKTATLAGDVTVNSGNGNAAFNGAVDADAAANNRTLAVNSGGVTTFGAAVGGNQRLASLTTDAPGTTSARSVTTLGNIIFNDDVTLNGTYDSSAGNGNFLAAKTATLAGNVTVSSGNGNATFTGTVDADSTANNRTLAVNSSGLTTFGAAVGGNQRLGSLTTDAAGTTTAKSVTTSGDINFNDDVTLNGTYDSSAANGNFLAGKSATLAGDVIVNSGVGNATLAGAVDADAAANNRALTVNSGGTTTFGSAVGGNQQLGSLTTDAAGTTSAKDVTTFGNISFNDDVTLNGTYHSAAGNGNFLAAKASTLAGNVIVTTGTGDATFGGTINADAAANGRTLTVNSGGATKFGAAVGGSQRLASLTTDALGTTSAKSVMTSGDISFNDDVTLDGTYDTTAGNGNFLASKTATLAGNTTVNSGLGNVTFNSSVDSDFAANNSLTVNSAGATTFGASVGSASPLGSLTTDAVGFTVLNGALVRTIGAQSYGDSVSLGAGATRLDGGAVSFSSTLNGVSSVQVNSAGTTTFGGAVGNTTPLASLTTDGLGTTAINGRSIKTTGAQTYGDDVTVGASSTLLNGSAASFSKTLNGGSDVTVDAANTTFSGAVGNDTALTSLTTDSAGTTAINGGLVATTGAQKYGDDVTVGAGSGVLSGGSVTFNKTLNGPSDLTVNSGGQTTFEGPVGNSTALQSLATDAAGTTKVNGPSVVTIAQQDWADDVILGAPGIILNGTTVRFGKTVNGACDLTVNASGQTTFNNGAGNITPLNSLNTDASGSTSINGNVTTANGQNYADPVTLAGNSIIRSIGNQDITFQKTVDGAHDLTVNTGGKTIFNAEVGKTAALASLTTDDQGVTQLKGNVTTTGKQNYGDAVELLANVRAASTEGKNNITFGSTVNGAHDLTVETQGDEIFSGAVGGTAPLASLTTDSQSSAGGTAQLLGGSVKTTGDQHYYDNVSVGNGVKLVAGVPGGAKPTVTFERTVSGFNVEDTTGLTVSGGAKAVFNGTFNQVMPLTFLDGHVAFNGSVFQVNPGNRIQFAAQDSGQWNKFAFVFNGLDNQFYSQNGATAPQEDLWRRILGAALARPGSERSRKISPPQTSVRPKLPQGENKGSGDPDAQ